MLLTSRWGKFPSVCPENYLRGISPPTQLRRTSQLHHMSPQAHSVYQQVSWAVIISQGVIWLASSGVTSREVSSEKRAGSQYCDSPAAWESNQARPSFSRWSWKHEMEVEGDALSSCSVRQLVFKSQNAVYRVSTCIRPKTISWLLMPNTSKWIDF